MNTVLMDLFEPELLPRCIQTAELPLAAFFFSVAFDVPRFMLRAAHQGQLIIPREETADLHCTLETVQTVDKSLLCHLLLTILT